MDYANDAVYKAFNSSSLANSEDAMAVSFAAIAYKDVFSQVADSLGTSTALDKTLGGLHKSLTQTHVCPAWRSFTQQSLYLPIDSVFFSTVTVSGMSKVYSGLQRNGVVTRNLTTYACTTSDFSSNGPVARLVAFINAPASSASSGRLVLSTCNGATWIAQRCAAGTTACSFPRTTSRPWREPSARSSTTPS
jgi:hypothetical protein